MRTRCLAAATLLAALACLDVAEQQIVPDQAREQSEPRSHAAWTAEQLTRMTGVYHDEEDVRQMGPGDTGWNADLILWRLYLRDAERELEEVLARYPNDAQRIEEAERGVRHSREVVDGFEWLIDPVPGPAPVQRWSKTVSPPMMTRFAWPIRSLI